MANPARGFTVVSFTLPAPASVRLAVCDLLGREVARLAEGPRGAGYHTVDFDTSRLGAGVYLLRLEAAGSSRSRRMAIVR